MNKQPNTLTELRAHAGKLVAEGKPLNGAFQYYMDSEVCWWTWEQQRHLPDFEDGKKWRIAKPKKQLIDWSHQFFKGCATNYGGLLSARRVYVITINQDGEVQHPAIEDLRLATLANDHANWQYFHSTPENDAKLRELAKMVKVQARCHRGGESYFWEFDGGLRNFGRISNYRITGECQEGWTDCKEDV